MATITNPTFGKMKGKVGDFILRIYNGKLVISARPHNRRKDTSPNTLARQKRFGINCKLSKCINKIDVFRNFWKNAANGKMSSFNAIAKANYPMVNDKGVCSPKLTPDSFNLDFGESGFNYHNNEIAIEFNPDKFDLNTDYIKDNYVLTAGVICLSNPVDNYLPEYDFFCLMSESAQVTSGQSVPLFIELTDSLARKVESYAVCKFCFGFASMDKDGNVLKTISTFTEPLICH